MQLVSAEYRNFRQHTNLNIDFDGNLIGLVGSNGKGKSNLIAGIQYALTGEVPGTVKEKLLQWGAERGHVEVAFKHEDHFVTVHRGLGGGRTYVEIDDDRVTGITKVNDALYELTGIDKDIGRMMFVQQAALDQVLFDLPSKREQAFQKLCGIGDANAIHRDIGTFLSVRMPEVPDYTAQLAAAHQRQEELEANLNGLTAELNALGPVQDTDALESDIALRITALSLLEQINRVFASIANDVNRQADLEEQKELLLGEGADTPLDKLDARLKALEDTQTKYREYLETQSQYNSALAALSALEQPLTDNDLHELEQRHAAVAQGLSRLQGSRKLYQDLLQTLQASTDTLTECPVCGSTITSKDAVIQRLDGLLAVIEQEAAQYDPEAAKQAYRQAVQQLETYKTVKATDEARVTALQERMQALAAVAESVVNLDELQAEFNAIREIRDEVADAQSRMHNITGQLTAIEMSLAENRSTLQKLEEQLKRLSDIDVNTDITEFRNELQDKQDKLTAIRNDNIERARLEGSIRQVHSDITSIKMTIKELETLREQQGTFEAVMHTLTDVRDFFHYNNGPRQLAVRVLSAMNDDVNMFLEKMNAPYSVAASDAGLTYMCRFHDGRNAPETGSVDAADLSGGEKVLLAVSFRLASYMMFANKIGLLTLDEPTAYLDESNISNFCELLDTIKHISRSLGLQLLMSTHERAVIPFVDTCIDLNSLA